MTSPTFTYARCYENERWYLVGWSNKLLPTDRYGWSDETGKIKLERDTLACPPSTKWISEWEAVVEPERTDNEGWMYATSFDDVKSESDYANKNFRSACVRRRQWRRAFRHVTLAERDAILQSYENARVVGPQNATTTTTTMNNLFGAGSRLKAEDSWTDVGNPNEVAPHTQKQQQQQQQQRPPQASATPLATAPLALNRTNINNNNNNLSASNVPPPLPTEANGNSAGEDISKRHEKKPSRGFAGLGGSLSSAAGSIIDALFSSGKNKDTSDDSSSQPATPASTTESEHKQKNIQQQHHHHHHHHHRDVLIKPPKNPEADDYKPDPLFASATMTSASPSTTTGIKISPASPAAAAPAQEDPFAVHTGNSHIPERGDPSKPDPLFAPRNTVAVSAVAALSPFSASPSTNNPHVRDQQAVDEARAELHRNYFAATSSEGGGGEYKSDPLFASSSDAPLPGAPMTKTPTSSTAMTSIFQGGADPLFSTSTTAADEVKSNVEAQQTVDDLLARFM